MSSFFAQYTGNFAVQNRFRPDLAPTKFVTFEENAEGKVVYSEWFQGQLRDFYDHVSGSIYVCSADPSIRLSHVKGVYIAESAVKVEKELHIKNVYEYILEQAENGHIIVKKHQQMSEAERNVISQGVVQAIHLQRLLFPERPGYDAMYAAFVKQRFPAEWAIASQMSETEIKNMIEQWRKTVQG